VIPGKILRTVFSQKDLKPRISILSRNSMFPLYPVVPQKVATKYSMWDQWQQAILIVMYIVE
jgi:hypothetical protein